MEDRYFVDARQAQGKIEGKNDEIFPVVGIVFGRVAARGSGNA
jgi:hypothetical protein